MEFLAIKTLHATTNWMDDDENGTERNVQSKPIRKELFAFAQTLKREFRLHRKTSSKPTFAYHYTFFLVGRYYALMPFGP